MEILTKTEFASKSWDNYVKRLNQELTAKVFADEIAQDIRDNFKNSVSFEGASLKPLKAETIAQKIKQGNPYPEKPLVASTQLGLSTEAFEISDIVAEVRVNDNRFLTGKQKQSITNTELLDIHQKERPVWGYGAKTKEKIQKLVNKIHETVTVTYNI